MDVFFSRFVYVALEFKRIIHLLNCSVEYVQLTIFSSYTIFFVGLITVSFLSLCRIFFLCCIRFSLKSDFFIESANFYLNVDINTHRIVMCMFVVVLYKCVVTRNFIGFNQAKTTMNDRVNYL